mmetsp:Transcript_24155/g.69721  ORF Transcript_24155/g.69721 Transcript_24155/m.69721 type:complete len:318 (+) Transcript_24155:68-1021(+)
MLDLPRHNGGAPHPALRLPRLYERRARLLRGGLDTASPPERPQRRSAEVLRLQPALPGPRAAARCQRLLQAPLLRGRAADDQDVHSHRPAHRLPGRGAGRLRGAAAGGARPAHRRLLGRGPAQARGAHGLPAAAHGAPEGPVDAALLCGRLQEPGDAHRRGLRGRDHPGLLVRLRQPLVAVLPALRPGGARARGQDVPQGALAGLPLALVALPASVAAGTLFHRVLRAYTGVPVSAPSGSPSGRGAAHRRRGRGSAALPRVCLERAGDRGLVRALRPRGRRPRGAVRGAAPALAGGRALVVRAAAYGTSCLCCERPL